METAPRGHESRKARAVRTRQRRLGFPIANSGEGDSTARTAVFNIAGPLRDAHTEGSTESGEKSWKQRYRSLQTTVLDVRNVRSGRQHGIIRANHDSKKFGSKIEDVEDRLNEFLELVRRYDEAKGTDPVPDYMQKACIISSTSEPLKTHLQLNVGKLGNFNASRVATEDYLRTDASSRLQPEMQSSEKGRARRVVRKEKKSTQAEVTEKR